MTIPPIGPQTGSLTPQEEPSNAKAVRQTRAAPEEPRQAEVPRNAETVELSQQARQIQERQAEITRMQVIERAAEAIQKEARAIKENSAHLEVARKAGDTAQTEQATRDIEQRLRNIEAQRDAARFQGEQLFSNREVTAGAGGQEQGIGMPQAAAETDRFVQETRDAVSQKRQVQETRVEEEMSRLQDRSKQVRSQIEKEVRDSIAGAVRESSTSRPRDAAEAERLIRQARESRSQDTQRATNIDQISSKAINLLQ